MVQTTEKKSIGKFTSNSESIEVKAKIGSFTTIKETDQITDANREHAIEVIKQTMNNSKFKPLVTGSITNSSGRPKGELDILINRLMAIRDKDFKDVSNKELNEVYALLQRASNACETASSLRPQ